ncbi:MAG: SDR family NAD(P)-dependent oxidoreductase [Gammaproteobacteria bacterium]|nr:SDR family NAD(P)-dependent oxidoreductase [Gammaproteobacteria bacterium]MXW46180.1 SDR family NAD(P)-dependent oxidoreductase [Gammaproteobacteria bacterium]MYD01714.1 SDR family NAD(P)-dependent oxidoreductase [Gammaproteobacteria bacterium]MYI26435.1 SDR family NAD(P)-dependent oxidoreductase [Gammaproteobacteria bacterium]
MRARPRLKNPILRTRQPLTPPMPRSRTALGLTAQAAEGRFSLQRCESCGQVQYPPADSCRACLSEELLWTPMSGRGELLAHTTLHHSNDPFYRERLPWRLGLTRLAEGPVVVAHLHRDCPPPPAAARVTAKLDKAGRGVLVALPADELGDMSTDPRHGEFSCDPEHRKVLVTDGKSRVGQALVRELAAAGAAVVWVGQAEPWKKYAGQDAIEKLDQATVVPLDLTDERGVKRIGAEIGGRVDILINNAELHRTQGIAGSAGAELARREMEVNYLGLLRLAQAFGPAMRARGADGGASATAWVNVLSVYALSNYPPQGTYSASKAAALSLSQCLRAEMQDAGIRVVNVFPGPIDEEWNQTLPPPKLAPERLARDIVQGLRDGVEDLFPGDVAKEWLERWKDNPKVLERELALESHTA